MIITVCIIRFQSHYYYKCTREIEARMLEEMAEYMGYRHYRLY